MRSRSARERIEKAGDFFWVHAKKVRAGVDAMGQQGPEKIFQRPPKKPRIDLRE
jgi:hypothetical protein